MNHILIFSCGYNCVNYIDNHIDSIRTQSYSNTTHVIIDDGSTDGTYEKLVDYKRSTDRNVRIGHYMNNSKSVIKSYVSGLYPNDNDIVVIVDLDDWLPDPYVLETINDTYFKHDCWMTHGSFVRVSNGTVQGEPYPDWVKEEKAYRKYPRWLAQHLRTFRGFLWNSINKDDLKDAFGELGIGAADISMTFPMLEMCPPDKIVHIKSVLYVYNDSNPLNEFKIKKDEEQLNDRWFRSKPKYKELKR